MGILILAIIGSIFATIIGFFLAVLLFRSACDLCSVQPPSFLRSCATVILMSLIATPVAAGIMYGFWAVGESFHLPGITISLNGFYGLRSLAETAHLPNINLLILGSLSNIPLVAIVAGLLYMPLARVGYLKGVKIYVIQSLLHLLVGSVLALLTVGGFTIVEGLVRAI